MPSRGVPLKKIDHALALAAKGFRVFPLSPGSKVPPKDFAWKAEATTDAAAIRKWWGNEPDYNVGIATGYGTIVVDADTKKGKPGLASLALLDSMDLPDSLRVATPSGGVHVYLRTPGQHRNRVDSIEGFKGIDIRSDGGYVVGPGSVLDGREYVVSSNEDIATSPRWFEDILLRDTPKHTAKSEEPLIELDLPQNVNRAVEYLKEFAPAAIEGEGGDETTYKVATRLRDFGLSKEVAFEVMSEHWNEAGKAEPPWSPEDLLVKIDNAFAYATSGWGAATAIAEFGALEIDVGESPIVKLREMAEAAPPAKKIMFTPYQWRDPATIPPRPFLYGKHFIAGFIGVTVSPGGLGKSALLISEALSMACGIPLIGERPLRKLRVVYWNGEDPQDELDRRFAAAIKHFGIGRSDLGDRLMVDSGRSLPLKLAIHKDGTVKLAKGKVNEIVEALKDFGADVFIADPFVTTHTVSENDNTAMNEVVDLWREIADRSGCAIDLVHHTTKQARLPGQAELLGAAQARGAGAIVDAARSERHLIAMNAEDAEKLGIENGHKRYFQVVSGKASMAPAAEIAIWRKHESVDLDNATKEYPEGDNVGVVVQWEPPNAEDGLEEGTLDKVKAVVAGSNWRESEQSAEWVGYAIAEVLGVDIGAAKARERNGTESAARAKVRRLVSKWRGSGDLVRVLRPDPKNRRDSAPFIEVGKDPYE